MYPSSSTYLIPDPCRSIFPPLQTDTICGLHPCCIIVFPLLYIPLFTRTNFHLGDWWLELDRSNMGCCVSVLYFDPESLLLNILQGITSRTDTQSWPLVVLFHRNVRLLSTILSNDIFRWFPSSCRFCPILTPFSE